MSVLLLSVASWYNTAVIRPTPSSRRLFYLFAVRNTHGENPPPHTRWFAFGLLGINRIGGAGWRKRAPPLFDRHNRQKTRLHSYRAVSMNNSAPKTLVSLFSSEVEALPVVHDSSSMKRWTRPRFRDQRASSLSLLVENWNMRFIQNWVRCGIEKPARFNWLARLSYISKI